MITDIQFEDFIGVFDTEFNPADFINYFDNCKDCNVAFNRGGFVQNGKKLADSRKDSCLPIDYFMDESNAPPEMESFMVDKNLNSMYLKRYNQVLNQAMNEYAAKYERLTSYQLQSAYLNIQKTSKTGGYHYWHCEDSSQGSTRRVLAHMMYLNDVQEGGETEFLYLSRRYKPIKGRLLIWPGGFTHTHRGNPPLSGDKYVATGWVENVKL
jgi:hypothetical protein